MTQNYSYLKGLICILAFATLQHTFAYPSKKGFDCNEEQGGMFMAASEGRTDVLNLYYDNGCNFNVVDPRGFTPYDVAALNGRKDSTEWLVKHNLATEGEFSSAMYKLLQTGLRFLNHDAGVIDGTMNKATAEGIRSFQKENKLAMTGKPESAWLGIFNKQLSKKMQAKLGELGFKAGTPDGVIGSSTRTAMQAFRQERNMPKGEYAHIDDQLIYQLMMAENEANKKAIARREAERAARQVAQEAAQRQEEARKRAEAQRRAAEKRQQAEAAAQEAENRRQAEEIQLAAKREAENAAQRRALETARQQAEEAARTAEKQRQTIREQQEKLQQEEQAARLKAEAEKDEVRRREAQAEMQRVEAERKAAAERAAALAAAEAERKAALERQENERRRLAEEQAARDAEAARQAERTRFVAEAARRAEEKARQQAEEAAKAAEKAREEARSAFRAANQTPLIMQNAVVATPSAGTVRHNTGFNRVSGSLQMRGNGSLITSCAVGGQQIDAGWCQQYFPAGEGKECNAVISGTGVVVSLTCK
ncbi:MAG: peptidoglycan-binding protein [Cardiobacteriaceae bacterium]|nr:peptidoglycan-binding protein [Cardiobacteriaceae bacterium]